MVEVLASIAQLAERGAYRHCLCSLRFNTLSHTEAAGSSPARSIFFIILMKNFILDFFNFVKKILLIFIISFLRFSASPDELSRRKVSASELQGELPATGVAETDSATDGLVFGLDHDTDAVSSPGYPVVAGAVHLGGVEERVLGVLEAEGCVDVQDVVLLDLFEHVVDSVHVADVENTTFFFKFSIFILLLHHLLLQYTNQLNLEIHSFQIFEDLLNLLYSRQRKKQHPNR